MSNTPEIIGNFLVQVLRLIANAFLVVALIAGKMLIGILTILTSWIEKILGKSEKH